ncbi:curlin [Bradyrhizobium sp. CCBAU 45394]|uniref:curlin n=1 Tax=Bradyrhizobium sp. CCBAU 45394 TaxID=1325087 RepID=UPI0023034566|nr:curlin [Bradyrhizobium sp. CCBAU 45394]MDA9393566.1 curlin [Bradyrhizobium sp. CCBAU 45394]
MKRLSKRLLASSCAAMFALCCAGAGSAGAQTADIKTIVSVGGPPVVLNQNSQLNMAGVSMVGGSTSATVVQNGTNNATGVLQFGGTNSASVGQAGMNNFAFVGQTGQSATSLVSQLGAMNTGTVAQFSTVNTSTIVQTGP